MAQRVSRLLAVLTVALAASAAAQDAGCARWRTAFAEMPERQLVIQSRDRLVPVRVKVADTPERLAAGFQCATADEIAGALILFDFEAEILTQFHMQNVPVALDIAFAKADGTIFSILRMQPSPTVLYGPLGRFRYALEARAGFFATEGIRAGAARLQLNP